MGGAPVGVAGVVPAWGALTVVTSRGRSGARVARGPVGQLGQVDGAGDAGVGDHAAAHQYHPGLLGARQDVTQVGVRHQHQVGDVAGRGAGARQAEHGAGAVGDRGQRLGGRQVPGGHEQRGRLERVGPAGGVERVAQVVRARGERDAGVEHPAHGGEPAGDGVGGVAALQVEVGDRQGHDPQPGPGDQVEHRVEPPGRQHAEPDGSGWP